MSQRVHINPNPRTGFRPAPTGPSYTPEPIRGPGGGLASAYGGNGGPGSGGYGGGSGSVGGGGVGGGRGGTGADEGIMRAAKGFSAKLEDLIEGYTQPIKPYIPTLARFLIVVTFLEDALRILTQWGDQVWYLQKHRRFIWGFSHLFLLLNVVAMLGGSFGVIAKKYPDYSVYALLGVVVAQGLGYGLIFDLSFFLRNLSVIGGLLMVLSEAMAGKKKFFAGLPSISETDRRKYFQLAGRVLLIFLFVGFVFQGSWSFTRVIVALLGLVACVMVIAGFKARWSASFLVTLLSVANLFVNNWWTMHAAHPQRDFKMYDFFQTLSIVGGLLLLVSAGPGNLSFDQKKKIY